LRWFKHMATSSSDERLSEMKDIFGLEGIGFWWTLLEVIALQMDGKNQRYEAAYSLSVWARKVGCHHHKVSVFFKKFESVGLIDMSYDGSNGVGKLIIGVPNLIKYRDEYSGKKGGTLTHDDGCPM